jgi:hypothetical protein
VSKDLSHGSGKSKKVTLGFKPEAYQLASRPQVPPDRSVLAVDVSAAALELDCVADATVSVSAVFFDAHNWLHTLCIAADALI